MGRFPPVPPEPDFPTQELRVLDLWEQTDAFRRSVQGRDATSCTAASAHSDPSVASRIFMAHLLDL